MAHNIFNLLLESTEEPELSPEEKLHMFLYSAGAYHRAGDLFQVFNVDFRLDSILASSRNILVDRWLEYEDIVAGSDGSITLDGEQYVHLSVFTSSKVENRRLSRCLDKMPHLAIRVETTCSIHRKKCRLLRFNCGFLCFLHLLTDDSEPQQHAENPILAAPLEDEPLDEEVPFDLEEERALLHSDDIASSMTESAIADEHGDIPLSCFPTFPLVHQKDYVLLTDIMYSFNIREDYCLAAISNFCEADEDWIDEDYDAYLLSDSAVEDSQYRQGNDILKNLFDEARLYEAQLPSEQEAAAIAQRLGLSEMGKFEQPITHDDTRSTIPLWTNSLLEADENQKVFVYEDDFVRRAGGTRSSGASSSNSTHHRKDAALLQYVRNFNYNKIVIFHKEYSKDNAKFPLFAFKVLSTFFGGNEIPLNAEKVVLIEKQFALRVFGLGHGCQALRCPYYLSYTAGALAAGIHDPGTLSHYGKRELLRSKKGRSIQGASTPRIELPDDAEDIEEGQPGKRIKARPSSNPSSPSFGT